MIPKESSKGKTGDQLNFILKNCLPKSNYFYMRRKTQLQIEQSLFDELQTRNMQYNSHDSNILDPDSVPGFYL